MVRDICLKAVKYKFRFWVKWIPREYNEIADALSKLDLVKFQTLCTQNNLEFTQFPMLFQRPFGSF